MAPLRRLIDEFLAADGGGGVDEVHQLLAGVSRLLDVTSVLAGEVVPRQILRTIVQEACRAIHCEQAVLLQFDADRHELYSVSLADEETAVVHCPLDQGIAGYVATHRELINLDDPGNDRRWTEDPLCQNESHPRNLLAAPLIAARDNSLLGVLLLLDRDQRPFDQVDEELAVAFSQHASAALQRVQLAEQLNRRQAIQASLEVARDIQRGFMPSRLPQISRYEVAAWWRSNEAVGGDYCDVLPLKDGRLGLVVADVSGHGLGPSLLMASLRAALHAMVFEHTAPEVLMGLLGRSLKPDLQDGRFITAILAVLNPKDDSVEYANAGHAPALHYDASDGEFLSLESTGMPLGVADLPEFPQGWPIELDAGDLLVLGTDGLTEAMNGSGEQFGLIRLERLIHSAARRPVKEIVERVGKEVESFVEGGNPPDDLTLLVLRRNR